MAVLIVCFAVSALIVVPIARRWPPWLEAELVLLVWWPIWTAALAYLLHRGHKLSDDHSWRGPRNWLGQSSPDIGNVGDIGFDLVPAEGCAEGCVGAIVALLVVVLLFAAAWFVIELAIPALAFGVYLLLRGMLARVANDHHGCEGSWPRAISWALVWATVYVLPQAGLVWLVHMIAKAARVA